MRVIAGIWGGRNLVSLEGDQTRPTSDRVKESLASSIYSYLGDNILKAHVLDAFAGSGSLGIEMLSRGARKATFVEKDQKAVQIIKKNLQELKAAPETFTLYEGDVFKKVGRFDSRDTFDVVFIDPPYAVTNEKIQELIDSLIEHNLLSNGCLLMYEHDKHGNILTDARLHTLKSKKFGSTQVELYMYEA